MAPWVKEHPTKAEDLSSIPRSSQWKENQSYTLASDLHICCGSYVATYINTQ